MWCVRRRGLGCGGVPQPGGVPATHAKRALSGRPVLQDMAAVEDARQACLQSGMQVLEGFVRVVQMRPPRANAVVA